MEGTADSGTAEVITVSSDDEDVMQVTEVVSLYKVVTPTHAKCTYPYGSSTFTRRNKRPCKGSISQVGSPFHLLHPATPEVILVSDSYHNQYETPAMYVIADDDHGSASEDNLSSVSRTYGQRTSAVGNSRNEKIATATSSSNAGNLSHHQGTEISVITLETISDAETETEENPEFEEDLAYSFEATRAIQTLLKSLKGRLTDAQRELVSTKIWKDYKAVAGMGLEKQAKLSQKISLTSAQIDKLSHSQASLWELIKELMDYLNEDDDLNRQLLQEKQSAKMTENHTIQIDHLEREREEGNKCRRKEGGLKAEDREEIKRLKMIELEGLLKDKAEQIVALGEEEINLDDTEHEENSAYCKRDRLIRKVVKYYEQLCDMSGCSKLTERPVHTFIRIANVSTHPEFDEAIQSFMSVRSRMLNAPNFDDILSIVEEANVEKSLGLDEDALATEAEILFKFVMCKLRGKREADTWLALLPDVEDADDPAVHDLELQKKLEENCKRGKNMNDAMKNFTGNIQQILDHDDGESSEASSSEEDEPDTDDSFVVDNDDIEELPENEAEVDEDTTEEINNADLEWENQSSVVETGRGSVDLFEEIERSSQSPPSKKFKADE